MNATIECPVVKNDITSETALMELGCGGDSIKRHQFWVRRRARFWRE